MNDTCGGACVGACVGACGDVCGGACVVERVCVLLLGI